MFDTLQFLPWGGKKSLICCLHIKPHSKIYVFLESTKKMAHLFYISFSKCCFEIVDFIRWEIRPLCNVIDFKSNSDLVIWKYFFPTYNYPRVIFHFSFYLGNEGHAKGPRKVIRKKKNLKAFMIVMFSVCEGILKPFI